MSVSRALLRLLRIRDLEEEQARLALEAASADLRGLERARAVSVERARRGRRLVAASAGSGELADRLAGLAETHAAERGSLALAPRILRQQQATASLREEFMAARVERRQAATLIEEAAALDAIQSDRKAQQELDDWFRNRQHRAAGPAAELQRPAATAAATDILQSSGIDEPWEPAGNSALPAHRAAGGKP